MSFVSTKKQKERDSHVLVPPLLERDHRGRSRMVKSSFDIQFSKLQLKWLFNDYLWPGANGLLRFSPAEDRRITAKARMGSSLEKLGANAAGTRAPLSHSAFVERPVWEVLRPVSVLNPWRLPPQEDSLTKSRLPDSWSKLLVSKPGYLP